ncbi:hypothetical protein [Xanthomonas arboricola]|uniref:hypothetical protein n=1 Tax=Xanthomonas arboricola TaxID=56448 RepID=UPI001EE81A05|nr:hypothetical protein [Xanthomonas arboricola]
MPASLLVDLFPAFAHRLRQDVAQVLRRLAARAAVERAINDPAHSLSRQLGVLPHILRRRFARMAVPLQQYVAATITRHHAEAS